ncbi:LCP family protein [Saccharopolyspora sp. ASAGF58]|uniref:LCP family protein n=1 Tax=Saccharopolyspora sp. ASAGF58 TaxID=2719023 RepID=UPI001FF0CE2C|nr:LCP family protein [Saccharopolyspora sp. ASAGF58]
MPQDPRHGEFGHRRSRPDEDAADSGTSASTGRRRRALSDDGTGGTRVIDLLSKHGKAPSSGTSRRRAAEPEPPQAPQAPQPPQASRASRASKPRRAAEPPKHPASPAARPEPPASPSDWTAPEGAPRRSRSAPPNHPSTPPATPPGWAPPAAGPPSAQAPNGKPRQGRRRALPDGPALPADASAGRARPNPGAAATFAGGAAARNGAPTEPPMRNGALLEPPARNGAPAPMRNGAEPAAAEPTRIAQALTGEPAPAKPPHFAPRPPAARQVPPAVEADLEATTQHPAIPAEPPKAEQTAMVARPQQAEQTAIVARPKRKPADDEKTTFARPVAPPVADAEATAIVAPAVSGGADAYDEFEQFDEFEDDADEAEDDVEERKNDIKEIDATLARFSAVHDEIAAEEAARRKKYAWLLGRRREPELGTDIPFDFVEGRDGQSRMEWKKKQRKRRTNLIVMAVAMAASLTVFLTLGIAWGATTIWGPPSVQALDPNSDAIKDVAKQTGDQNFLLVGSDTRAGASAEDGVGSEQDEPGARADTTIIAHIPADRSRVVLVSFPRDLKVDMPACERWDSTTGKYTGERVPARKDARLNSAYAVGGPLCTTKVIQQISGLRVNSFLGIDFQGFKSMVDAVQGVEICTDKPIIDTTLGTVLPQAGRQTLTGEQALNYVRARHVKGDPTSDYGRMQRQQLFLSALLRKAMSSQVLLDPGKLGDFVKAVSANTFGENIGVDRLMDLGQQMQGLDASRVTFITVPTTGYADENGMEILREADTKSLFQAILDEAPIMSGSGGPAALTTPSGGGAAATMNDVRRQPADPNQPPAVPNGLSTVNAGTDICG